MVHSIKKEVENTKFHFKNFASPIKMDFLKHVKSNEPVLIRDGIFQFLQFLQKRELASNFILPAVLKPFINKSSDYTFYRVVPRKYESRKKLLLIISCYGGYSLDLSIDQGWANQFSEVDIVFDFDPDIINYPEYLMEVYEKVFRSKIKYNVINWFDLIRVYDLSAYNFIMPLCEILVGNSFIEYFLLSRGAVPLGNDKGFKDTKVMSKDSLSEFHDLILFSPEKVDFVDESFWKSMSKFELDKIAPGKVVDLIEAKLLK